MIYDYECAECGNVQEESCSVDAFKELKPQCHKCGGECSYKYTPTVCHVAFKDGPSGSWPSKGGRFKKYRERQSQIAAQKQRDHCEPMKLVPNYKGQEAGSWREAQSMASRDKDNESAAVTASTYDNAVKQESSS